MGTGQGVASHEFIPPWPPEEATAYVRKMANAQDFQDGFNACWTDRVKERLKEYNLIFGDIIHVFKNGVINVEGELSTRPGIFKYKMSAETPNSNGKYVTVDFCVGKGTKDLKVNDITIS